MAKLFLVPIDHNYLESYNFRFQVLATNPSTNLSEGRAYYSSAIKSVMVRNDTEWVPIDPSKVSDGYIPLSKVNGAAPITNPSFTGIITVPAGNATKAGGIQLTSGTLKTTPTTSDSGSIEYDGTSLSFIDSTGTRRTLGVSGAGIQSISVSTTSTGLAVTPGGTASAPTFDIALSGNLAAIEAINSNGFLKRTGTNTWQVGTVSLTTEVSGTLPVANGGTGTTTSTGSGSNVLSTSPALSGTPTAPTAAVDTNTTQLATTAFVVGQAATATPQTLGTAAAGTSTRFARGDHVHAMPTLSQVLAPTAAVSFNNQRITSLADPTSDQDAANKRYVDNAVAGLPWKEEVLVATTANIANLSSGAPNTVDGISLSVGSRILVRAQTNQTQNGIYTVTTVGTGSNGVWARSSDADTGAELSGMAVFVVSGSTNGGIRFVSSNTGTIVVGTTNITYAVFDAVVSYTNGNGIALTGTTFSINLSANSGLVSDGSGLRLDTTVVSRKYSTTIGDGTSTQITITHNLATNDVISSVYLLSSGDNVECDITRLTTNTMRLGFAVAPALNSLRVVVQG